MRDAATLLSEATAAASDGSQPAMQPASAAACTRRQRAALSAQPRRPLRVQSRSRPSAPPPQSGSDPALPRLPILPEAGARL